MNKELSLISLIFNPDHTPEARQRLENIIEQGLDWDYIFKIIVLSDIAPLTCYYLSRLKNNNIPDWFMQKLNDNRNNTITANMFLWKNLRGVLQGFDKENIPAILLKGAFMSDIIYENIAMRSLVDIDIMVKEKDLLKIDAILKNNSYAKIKEYPGEILYKKETGVLYDKLPIEIHYKLRLPSEILILSDFLWNNPIIKETNGLKMLYPSIENSLIYSALHFFHHLSEVFMWHCGFPGIKSILDIHEIITIKNDCINWKYITGFSKRYKTRHILYLSLLLSKLYFGTRIPENFMRSLKPNFIKKMLVRFWMKDYIDIQTSKNTICARIQAQFTCLMLMENCPPRCFLRTLSRIYKLIFIKNAYKRNNPDL
ncbi:MAG: nucleotidyltransferase family protein [Candidatus Omnitrophica bacterium]|nr:nucleotidyltransferase family protein [Candidatus Omnitrophota bacterium]